MGAGIATVGAGMSAAITAPFIALGVHLLQGSQDAAHAAGQVKAALTSMGDASGKTFEQLSASAEALRNLSGVDDDEILTKLTANMLSFGSISGDAFDRAQLAALNLSARMQGDLQGATMMVGKALNDPVKGLAALGRAGIQFTAQQKDQIKAMVAVGDTAGAQGIMLGELERQFGGAAEAAGNADVWKPMKTALMDLEGAFEPIVRDVIGPLIAKVAEITRAFAGLSPETQKFIAIGAAVAAAIGPLLVGLGGVVTAVGALLPVFGAVAAVMSGPVILAVGAAVLAFLAFKDDIIPVVMQFAAALKETLGPKIEPLFDALKGAVAAIGEVFGAIFGGGGGSSSAQLKAWGQSIAQVFGAALDLITGAINIITNVFRALGALLRGDFSAMWGFLWQAVKAAVGAILNAFETLFPGVIASMRKLVEGVTSWLQGKLFGVLRGVIDKVKGVSDAFFKLYDAVVGHSYIPDMVIEIGQWMQRLDQNMVAQAQKATNSTAEAFEAVRDRANAALEGLLTDSERAWREHAQTVKALQDGIALGGPDAAAWKTGLARENAGWDARGLSLPEGQTLTDVGDMPGVQAVNSAIARMNQAITDSREKFADAFASGIDSALRGDWEGVLRAIVGDTFQDAIKGIGRSLSDAFGGGSSGGGFDWASLLKSFKLPGFKTGGSFRVGGAGGIDSSLVAFKATPGEMVDIRRPGQGLSGGGKAPMHFDLTGAVMTADLLAQMQQMATATGGAAFAGARQTVPSDMARTSRYTRGRS
ncbi:MAG: phage tail length tape measure family protein [Candidatus Brevundimonas phytovorans]|nr:phage tail length tape measure family protein [Brevundimonas sp.]WEK56489.1 MAG: phage tail length tape measure family protein [Brevundimonas sp.]